MVDQAGGRTFGMVAGGLSLQPPMCAAALTERKRLHFVHSCAAPLTVFWLVPQFLLVGAGEAVTYIGQLDFFLRECPKGMKSMSTIALGFYISSTIVTIVHKVTGASGKGVWLPDDLNKGKLYNFYWLLALLSVVNMALFMETSRRYVYKEKRLAEAGVELAEEICIHA